VRPVQSESPKPKLITAAAKNLMATFERGITPLAHGEKGGTRPRARLGKINRGIRYPTAMHREEFATKAERDDRFRILRATEGARDVTKGYDVDKWYVAWNGKAG